MFWKITKNDISRKLKGFEQSYLEARVAAPDWDNPDSSQLQGKNFQILKKKII